MAAPTVIKTKLKVVRMAHGIGQVTAVAIYDGPQGLRRVNFEAPLTSSDGDVDTEMSLDMHGPEVSWASGGHDISFAIGEARSSTETYPKLELHCTVERRTSDVTPPERRVSGSGAAAST